MVFSRWVHGGFMVLPWWVGGAFVVALRCIRVSVVFPWCFHGETVVILWWACLGGSLGP